MRDRDRRRFDDMELRLEKLEGQHQRLRDFIVPAYWNALDRLAAAVPDDGLASCLACGHTGHTRAFSGRVDECVFGGGAWNGWSVLSVGASLGR